MRELSGNVWPTQLLDGSNNPMVTLDRTRDTRYFEMRTEAMMRFFDKVAIKYGDVNADMLGIFGRMNIGRDLKARIGSLTTPNHLFSNRKNGCVWTPKGRVRLNTTEVETCPIEVNMEQCPDGLWGDCMEMLFGTGNDVRDLRGTPEGEALFQQFLRQVFIGIGNSFFMYTAFSNHPMIETANTLGFYTGADDTKVFVRCPVSEKGKVGKVLIQALHTEPVFDSKLAVCQNCFNRRVAARLTVVVERRLFCYLL